MRVPSHSFFPVIFPVSRECVREKNFELHHLAAHLDPLLGIGTVPTKRTQLVTEQRHNLCSHEGIRCNYLNQNVFGTNWRRWSPARSGRGGGGWD
jgi:hypothetical protein